MPISGICLALSMLMVSLVTVPGIYLTLIMAMTATSILICVIVLNLHHRDPNAPVPTWLRKLTYNIMAPIVCMRSHTTNCKGQAVYQLCEIARDYAVNLGGLSEPHSADSDSNLQYLPAEENNIGDQHYYMLGRTLGKKRMILEEILKHLRQITAKLKEREEQEALRAEWKVVAKILDRFFLMIFVCIVIISSTTLLFVYPLLGNKR